MAKFYLTKKAVEDLNDIWNYTYEEWSERQADKYYFSLLKSIQLLAEKPNSGKKYDIVLTELLGYKSEQHIIFYSVLSTNEIEVVRILHGSMDLKSKFE